MRRRTVAAALPLLAAPVLIAGPASAQTLRGSDPGHDMQWFDAHTFAHHPAADHADGDLRHFVVRYGAKAIRVAETFRALDHSEPVLVVGGTFKLPSGATHDLVLQAQKGSWRGTAKLKGRPACAVGHRIDYAAGRVTFVVPASCLGTPKFVRFQADSITTDSARRPTYFFADVAPSKSVMRNNKFTDRIFRG